MKYYKLTLLSAALCMSLAGMICGNSARAGDAILAGQDNTESTTPMPTPENGNANGDYRGGHPRPIHGCTVLDQAGQATPTCASNAAGTFQCYADVMLRSTTQRRIWAHSCVADASSCLATGANPVMPCYVVE